MNPTFHLFSFIIANTKKTVKKEEIQNLSAEYCFLLNLAGLRDILNIFYMQDMEIYDGNQSKSFVFCVY